MTDQGSDPTPMPPPTGQPVGSPGTPPSTQPPGYRPAPFYPPPYPHPGYYPPPNPYGYPGYPRDHPQAGLALGLGLGGLIGGFFTLGIAFILGPFAWAIGQKAQNEIKRSNGAFHPEGNATAGMVLGIVSTVFLVLAILIWIIVIVAAVNDPNFDSGTNAAALLRASS